MKGLIFFLIGLFIGSASGYLLLKIVLPPILSRMLAVRDRYNEMRLKFQELRDRIAKGKEDREELKNEIDEFLKKHGIA